MQDIKIINGVAYVRSDTQPKNTVQSLMPASYWQNPNVNRTNCTGATTAKGLVFIAKAMLNPNTPQSFVEFIKDDHGCGIVQGYVYDMIEEQIAKLGLQFLNVDRIHKTLTYEIF